MLLVGEMDEVVVGAVADTTVDMVVVDEEGVDKVTAKAMTMTIRMVMARARAGTRAGAGAVPVLDLSQ